MAWASELINIPPFKPYAKVPVFDPTALPSLDEYVTLIDALNAQSNRICTIAPIELINTTPTTTWARWLHIFTTPFMTLARKLHEVTTLKPTAIEALRLVQPEFAMLTAYIMYLRKLCAMFEVGTPIDLHDLSQALVTSLALCAHVHAFVDSNLFLLEPTCLDLINAQIADTRGCTWWHTAFGSVLSVTWTEFWTAWHREYFVDCPHPLLSVQNTLRTFLDVARRNVVTAFAFGTFFKWFGDFAHCMDVFFDYCLHPYGAIPDTRTQLLKSNTDTPHSIVARISTTHLGAWTIEQRVGPGYTNRVRLRAKRATTDDTYRYYVQIADKRGHSSGRSNSQSNGQTTGYASIVHYLQTRATPTATLAVYKPNAWYLAMCELLRWRLEHTTSQYVSSELPTLKLEYVDPAQPSFLSPTLEPQLVTSSPPLQSLHSSIQVSSTCNGSDNASSGLITFAKAQCELLANVQVAENGLKNLTLASYSVAPAAPHRPVLSHAHYAMGCCVSKDSHAELAQNARNSPAQTTIKATAVQTLQSESVPLALEEHDAYTCVVCMDRERSVVFLPCKHFVCCTACTATLNVPAACPMCRQSVQSTIDVYKS